MVGGENVAATSGVGSTGGLDKNAFLQLLVTQMQYQDPLQPQDNTQFLAQLAQFTALEQLTNVAESEQSVLDAVNALQQLAQVAVEQRMIGSRVTVQDGNGQSVSGQVTGIRFQNGVPELVVGDSTYPLSAVVDMEASQQNG
ncbi:MAG: flagellar hook capping protein [Alicyclobacillaceae bacterium]|nr:flagellar hook capping protein [Alicyclobacillaceae bacterium]